MPRKAKYTNDQIVAAVKGHASIQGAAAALGISRQALLAYRKKPEIIAAMGLPPATPTEQANKERARERKAELRAAPRAPDLDDITKWLFHVVEQAGKAKRLENQLAMAQTESADLRKEIERLKGRLSLLDRAEQEKKAFALLRDQEGLFVPRS